MLKSLINSSLFGKGEKNKWSKIENWNDYEKTIELIKNCHNNYLTKLKKN